MNTFRKIICVLGLTMVVASVAFAQSVAQGAAMMDSCCCCGDSCDRAKKDAMKNHVMSSDKAGRCACCSDSCEMKKDVRKNHVSSAKDGCCCACCGDSCDMKKKDAMKNHVNSSDKHECCCGDSCDLKNMKDTKKS